MLLCNHIDSHKYKAGFFVWCWSPNRSVTKFYRDFWYSLRKVFLSFWGLTVFTLMSKPYHICAEPNPYSCTLKYKFLANGFWLFTNSIHLKWKHDGKTLLLKTNFYSCWVEAVSYWWSFREAGLFWIIRAILFITKYWELYFLCEHSSPLKNSLKDYREK